MVHEVHDMFPLILESALKMLLKLLSQWKMAETNKEEEVGKRRYPWSVFFNEANNPILVFDFKKIVIKCRGESFARCRVIV